MKKAGILILAILCAVFAAACGAPKVPVTGGSGASSADPSGTITELAPHKIAVMVYDRGDDEVVSFRQYLTEYIQDAFNVEFLYSDNVLTEEEAQEFLRTAAEYGAEGVMSFIVTDLEAEVKLCEELGLYYIVASGSVSNADFAAVENNPWFLGTVGPGSFIEYKAGADMARHFLEEHQEDKEYFVLSGGGCFGNEMHLQRTMGILDTLLNAYGAKTDQTTEEIAQSAQVVEIETDKVKICVCPGYHTMEEYLQMGKDAYAAHPYRNVLAVLPATHLLNEIKGARLAVVDCYSETNLRLFTNGMLDYLVGKYSSIVGPGFAAMYNAVTGHAETFRDHGKAFHITQGFWISDSAEDFNEKYALASSVAVNAYNYEDLQSVMPVFVQNASLDDLKALAEAYSFSDAEARRAE